MDLISIISLVIKDTHTENKHTPGCSLSHVLNISMVHTRGCALGASTRPPSLLPSSIHASGGVSTVTAVSALIWERGCWCECPGPVLYPRPPIMPQSLSHTHALPCSLALYLSFFPSQPLFLSPVSYSFFTVSSLSFCLSFLCHSVGHNLYCCYWKARCIQTCGTECGTDFFHSRVPWVFKAPEGLWSSPKISLSS